MTSRANSSHAIGSWSRLQYAMRRTPWTPAVGAVIGAVTALALYDRRIIAGNPGVWQSADGDSGSGLAGFRYFVNEPWSWSLFRVRSLGHTLITTTDSNTALALLAKLARPLGFTAEDWWGGWFVLALVLQGGCAVIAVRAFGVRNRMLELAAALLAVFSPILLLRAFHPNLMGHFTLLLALAVVGHLHRSPRPYRAAWFGAALVWGSPFIHPYFLPMVAVTVTAATLAEVIRRRITWRAFAVWFGVLAAVLFGLLVSSGMIQHGLVPDRQGFVIHSAFVGWPLIPQHSGLWPGEEPFAHPFSFEGFNYLGAGVLLLAVIGVAVGRGSIRAWIREHQVVLAGFTGCGLYALSPRLVFTNTLVWDLRRTDTLALLATLSALVGLVVTANFAPLRRIRPPLRRGVVTVLGVVSLVLARWLASQLPQPTRPVRRRELLALTLLVAAALIVLLLRRFRWARPWWPAGALASGSLVAIAVALIAVPGVLDTFTSSIRASGRLMWISWYGALVFGVVMLSRLHRERWAPVLAAACCLLQFIDTQPLHGWANRFVIPDSARVRYTAQLRQIIAGHRSVHLVPPLSCTLVDPSGFAGFRDTVMAASVHLIPVDVTHSARAVDEPCPDRYSINRDPAVITIAALPVSRTQLGRLPAGFSCAEFGALTICSAKRTNRPTPQLAQRR